MENQHRSNGLQSATESGKQGSTFTLFPKLPVELRLKIFRRMFPKPQHVQLDIPPITSTGTMIDRTPPQLPITLSINRESRTETLRHYHIIHPGPLSLREWLKATYNATPEQFHDSGIRVVATPFGIDPIRDLAFISAISLFEILSPYAPPLTWPDNIYQQAPTLLDSIQEVAVREFVWGQDPKRALLAWKQMRKDGICLPFLRFRGLRKIVFVLQEDQGQGDIENTDWDTAPASGKEEFLAFMKDLLEDDKGVWSGKIPHVSIENWSPTNHVRTWCN